VWLLHSKGIGDCCTICETWANLCAPQLPNDEMTTIYTARWVLPVAIAPIDCGAIAIEGTKIVAVGPRVVICERFPSAKRLDFENSAIIPGLVNTHTHFELTAMRGYLEHEESDFFAWLRKLTRARLEQMTPDDIRVAATWGACEAVRAGITSVGDASDSALMSMRALQEVGLRGVVFQESFGPDSRLVNENFDRLKTKVSELQEVESELVRTGVSPHAPYTVCGPQLELIADYAQGQGLPLMMHAAESAAEDQFVRDGCGMFAEGLKSRNIDWTTPGVSTVQHLKQRGILNTQPLLAHCVRVDDQDLESLRESNSKVAHCPKSNAKLGHGRAPFAQFIDRGIAVGLGSDSVASNNTCDILEESRFAALVARADRQVTASEVFRAATIGGARCLGLDGVVGELTEAAQADFAVVSLDSVHQVPGYDPISTLVFASSGRDVVLTAVAGKEVFRDGGVTGVDEERLRARMDEISLKLSV
jgi:cytosine/adenosine deaminase-related metal-dependent hydrolase